jgi:hypothetical protein
VNVLSGAVKVWREEPFTIRGKGQRKRYAWEYPK